MENLVGTQWIRAFPRSPLVVSVRRHPGRRYLLKFSQVEAGFAKQHRPINRIWRSRTRGALRRNVIKQMQTPIWIEINRGHSGDSKSGKIWSNFAISRFEISWTVAIPEPIGTGLFSSQFVPAIN